MVHLLEGRTHSFTDFQRSALTTHRSLKQLWAEVHTLRLMMKPWQHLKQLGMIEIKNGKNGVPWSGGTFKTKTMWHQLISNVPLWTLCHDTMFPHFGQKHFATKYKSKTPFKALSAIRFPLKTFHTQASWDKLVLNHHISWGVSWCSCDQKEMMQLRQP